MNRILLVDDDEEHLENLRMAVLGLADENGLEVATWRPSSGAGRVDEEFEKQLTQDVLLVVTDYDLTLALPGLFGDSVVSWCQAKALPVADYSRGNQNLLPGAPDVFEFRVPQELAPAAQRIVGIAKGFQTISDELQVRGDVLAAPSPAAMLADLLGKTKEVSNLSLYEMQLGSRSPILELWRQDGAKKRVATYLLGHMLFNLVMRYPGPILDGSAICAYFATHFDGFEMLEPLLTGARYEGPFDTTGQFFWRDAIDDLVVAWSDDYQDIPGSDDLSTYRRALAEARLGSGLPRHGCQRCDGERGGYLCPFTGRVVCERDDCSVGTTSWLPHGADLARVEKDYYDETAPMLGF